MKTLNQVSAALQNGEDERVCSLVRQAIDEFFGAIDRCGQLDGVQPGAIDQHTHRGGIGVRSAGLCDFCGSHDHLDFDRRMPG